MVKATKIGVAAIKSLERFTKLEQNLAVLLAFTPLLLIWFDAGPIRDSISAYYNMEHNVIFYVPLTMAAMLLVVNGVINKPTQWYNWVLGVFLFGVILFNQDDFSLLHNIFAALFFISNVLVIFLFSSIIKLQFRVVLGLIIILALAGWYLFDAFTLFWAEWISLGIIALHFILESSLEELRELLEIILGILRGRKDKSQ